MHLEVDLKLCCILSHALGTLPTAPSHGFSRPVQLNRISPLQSPWCYSSDCNSQQHSTEKNEMSFTGYQLIRKGCNIYGDIICSYTRKPFAAAQMPELNNDNIEIIWFKLLFDRKMYLLMKTFWTEQTCIKNRILMENNMRSPSNDVFLD